MGSGGTPLDQSYIEFPILLHTHLQCFYSENTLAEAVMLSQWRKEDLGYICLGYLEL